MCSKCVPSVCPPICHESDLVRRSKADNLPNWTISHDRDEDFDYGDHDDHKDHDNCKGNDDKTIFAILVLVA